MRSGCEMLSRRCEWCDQLAIAEMLKYILKRGRQGAPMPQDVPVDSK